MKKILAFIPVAGKATRMYPISLEIPKHQLPINGLQLEDYIINSIYQLQTKKYDIDIYKNTEDLPLGTAYSFNRIPSIQKYDDIIVWYGDIYSEIDLESLLLFHEKKNSSLTIVSKKVMNSETKKGLFTTGYNDFITDFKKGNHYIGWNPIKKWQNKFKTPYKDAGILVFNKRGTDYVLEFPHRYNDKEYDLSTHIFPTMVHKRNCYAFTTDAFTQDIGTMDKYLEVICRLRNFDYQELRSEMKKI